MIVSRVGNRRRPLNNDADYMEILPCHFVNELTAVCLTALGQGQLPVITVCWPSAVSMLGQRLRRFPGIETALGNFLALPLHSHHIFGTEPGR